MGRVMNCHFFEGFFSETDSTLAYLGESEFLNIVLCREQIPFLFSGGNISVQLPFKLTYVAVHKKKPDLYEPGFITC